MDIEEIPASIKAAFTDNRIRYKYAILRGRSDGIDENELNTYGQLGWEVASMSEVLHSDKWGNTWFHTTIILKHPYQLDQQGFDDGQS